MACPECEARNAEMEAMKRKGLSLIDIMRQMATGTVVYATPEQYAARLAICEQCPRLFKLTGTCLECACFVQHKARFADTRCDLDKWDEGANRDEESLDRPGAEHDRTRHDAPRDSEY